MHFLQICWTFLALYDILLLMLITFYPVFRGMILGNKKKNNYFKEAKNMFENVLTKLVGKVYPERNYGVEKIGKRFFICVRDTTGCNDYLLEGKYSYDEVVKLNALTNCNASFGYCTELGPISFIGIPNPHCVGKDGFFKYNVKEYGSGNDESEYYFYAYTAEEAKKIGNYSVYGLITRDDEFEEICKNAKISKLCYVYDSRYKAKKIQQTKVYDMDCKLSGTYNYYLAKLLATGTLGRKKGYSGDERPICFATVGENYHVGIIGIWECDTKLVSGFRDVWEYGCEEPEIKKIRFLTEKEARKIKDFVLYIYDFSFLCVSQKYHIEKYDRTLDKRFCFHLPDGTDYRLIKHNELLR